MVSTADDSSRQFFQTHFGRVLNQSSSPHSKNATSKKGTKFLYSLIFDQIIFYLIFTLLSILQIDLSSGESVQFSGFSVYNEYTTSANPCAGEGYVDKIDEIFELYIMLLCLFSYAFFVHTTTTTQPSMPQVVYSQGRKLNSCLYALEFDATTIDYCWGDSNPGTSVALGKMMQFSTLVFPIITSNHEKYAGSDNCPANNVQYSYPAACASGSDWVYKQTPVDFGTTCTNNNDLNVFKGVNLV